MMYMLYKDVMVSRNEAITYLVINKKQLNYDLKAEIIVWLQY